MNATTIGVSLAVSLLFLLILYLKGAQSEQKLLEKNIHIDSMRNNFKVKTEEYAQEVERLQRLLIERDREIERLKEQIKRPESLELKDFIHDLTGPYAKGVIEIKCIDPKSIFLRSPGGY